MGARHRFLGIHFPDVHLSLACGTTRARSMRPGSILPRRHGSPLLVWDITNFPTLGMQPTTGDEQAAQAPAAHERGAIEYPTLLSMGLRIDKVDCGSRLMDSRTGCYASGQQPGDLVNRALRGVFVAVFGEYLVSCESGWNEIMGLRSSRHPTNHLIWGSRFHLVKGNFL